LRADVDRLNKAIEVERALKSSPNDVPPTGNPALPNG